MAITRISTAAGSDYTGVLANSISVAPAFAATTGNHLTVLIRSAGTVAGVTDSAANTYTRAGTSPDGLLELWYAENIAGSAGLAVTATFTASVAYRHIVVVQHAGVRTSGSLGAYASGTAASGGTVSCTPTASASGEQVCIT